MKLLSFVLLLSLPLFGEVRVLTLRQALDLALAQNPDLLLARLDQQKARYQVTVTHDPFSPKVFAGSGAAGAPDFPTALRAARRPSSQYGRKWRCSTVRKVTLSRRLTKDARGAGVDVARRQEEVIYRVASLYLDAEQAARSLEAARRQADNLTRVRELMAQRVAEGRELAIESKKANLAVLRAGQRVNNMAADMITAESSLAQAMGFGPDDRARVAVEERSPLVVPVSEEASIEKALQGSNELKRLESNMQSKMLEIKSYRAERLPKVNLVAQYSLFAKYNYQDYFAKFQRNNAQLGASIEIPLLVGRAAQAQSLEAEQDIAKLRIEVGRTRARITGDLRVAYENLRRAEAERDVARADLDVTREELTIDLAQMDEGRLPLATVEALRATENEKWVAYYEAQHSAEVARLNVLRQTGTLEAALR